MTNPNESQVWHGHVRPNPDGLKARCGGPALCEKCKLEQTLFGDKKTDEEKILYWMQRAKEADNKIVELTSKLQEQQARIIATEANAARYEWLRDGVKIRQGKILPDVGTRMINKSEIHTGLLFTRWVSQEEMDTLIDAELEREREKEHGVRAESE